MKRQDLLTKEEFIPTRINQKFSCSQNRIKFYNNKANEFRHSIAYISKPLNTNIKIVIELMKGIKECVFHRQFLLGKGFSFGYYTHIEQYNGKNHHAVHNYILSISNDEIKIIKYR
jgi:hypothetical protein